jgi:hypothetical protein
MQSGTRRLAPNPAESQGLSELSFEFFACLFYDVVACSHSSFSLRSRSSFVSKSQVNRIIMESTESLSSNPVHRAAGEDDDFTPFLRRVEKAGYHSHVVDSHLPKTPGIWNCLAISLLITNVLTLSLSVLAVKYLQTTSVESSCQEYATESVWCMCLLFCCPSLQ